MIMDIMRSTSVERLKGILRSRYGKGLEISFLADTSDLEGLGSTTFSLKGGTLYIPISTNGRFLAVAKVPQAETLNESSLPAITETVKLILEPALYNWYLNQTENNALQDETHIVGGLHVVDETIQQSETETLSERSPVIMITSQNPHRLPRVATQVHEVLDRWAFIHWNEIRSQIATIQDLRDLGAMTIFVDDALNLSVDEKFILNEWIQTSRAETEPALVIGSSMSWSQLKNEKVLPDFLLNEAGFYQIEADRLPADRRFCEDAIKLLLDKEAALQ